MSPLVDLRKRPTRHSYSSIKTFKECPAKYAYSYIAKIPMVTTGAMDRGTRLHKLCEDYLMDKGPEVACPYDIRRIGLRIYNLRTHGAKAEETWLLDRNWEPTDNPDEAKIKAIVDVHWLDKDVLRLHDYKSGRPYADHDDQLELYSLIGLRRFPAVRRVESSALYIDSGAEGSQRSILREMFPHYAKRWVEVIGRLDDEVRFEPTAGNHCGRCAYRSSAGGPCLAEQRGSK